MSVRDPDEVRDAAREIVNGREYTDQQALIERIRDALSDPGASLSELYDRFIRLLGGNEGGAAAVFAWLVTLLLAAVVVAIVVRFVRGSSLSEVVPVSEPRTTTVTKKDLIDEAKEFERQRDWRRAIRSRHAALVASLDDKSVLRRQVGMTAREYANEVAINAPRIRNAFDSATTLFEWAWYSDDAPEQHDVERFIDLANDIEKRVLT